MEGTTTAWPTAHRETEVSVAVGQFKLIQEIVPALRQVRAEHNVPPSKNIEAFVIADATHRDMLDEEFSLISRLARTALAFVEWAPDVAGASIVLSGGTQLVVPLEGLVDVKKECARLGTELANLEKQLASLEGRLSNAGFLERAPVHVVDAERAKRDEWTVRREQLKTRIEALCGAA